MLNKIVLVGFMGSGKTTIGQSVAEALSWEFADCDRIIEAKCGCSITELFATQGETYFRQLEHHTIQEIAKRPGACVISSGGGVVENGYNMLYLRSNCSVIWLRASLAVIQSRLATVQNRPLLRQSQQALQSLFSRREALYRRYADVSVDANRSLDEVKAEVLHFVSRSH